jgi:hypothetical protein
MSVNPKVIPQLRHENFNCLISLSFPLVKRMKAKESPSTKYRPYGEIHDAAVPRRTLCHDYDE